MSLNRDFTSQTCSDCGKRLRIEETDPPICKGCLDIRLYYAAKESELQHYDTGRD